MCFKIKFPANPFKSLIYRSCYRPTRYSHIVCNFLMGLSKNKLLMDEVTLFICQNSQHRMNSFIGSHPRRCGYTESPYSDGFYTFLSNFQNTSRKVRLLPYVS